MDQILQIHFGCSIIRRSLQRSFNVYKYETKMKPQTRETERGNLDWSYVINSQASNPDRNKLIIKLCKYKKSVI